MSIVFISLLVAVLIGELALCRAKKIDKEETELKNLYSVRKLETELKGLQEQLGTIEQNLKYIQETGETDMATNNETVVFRCTENFKSRIEQWATDKQMNLSEACRNLINVELNKDRALFEVSDFAILFSRHLQSIGVISQEVSEETIEEVSKQYAEELEQAIRDAKLA